MKKTVKKTGGTKTAKTTKTPERVICVLADGQYCYFYGNDWRVSGYHHLDIFHDGVVAEFDHYTAVWFLDAEVIVPQDDGDSKAMSVD